jgi:hypothetical protein
MNDLISLDQELTAQLQKTRAAYINARVAALEAADAEISARWAFQQAVNRCISHNVDPIAPFV